MGIYPNIFIIKIAISDTIIDAIPTVSELLKLVKPMNWAIVITTAIRTKPDMVSFIKSDCAASVELLIKPSAGEAVINTITNARNTNLIAFSNFIMGNMMGYLLNLLDDI